MSHCTTLLIRIMYCLKNCRHTEQDATGTPEIKSCAVGPHPISKNTVPAGLFKALANCEADTSRRLRSLLTSRDVFDVSPSSLDDNRMPTVSQKISRPRLVTDPINNINGDKPLGSSTPPPIADDVRRYLRATALRTGPSPIPWPHPRLLWDTPTYSNWRRGWIRYWTINWTTFFGNSCNSRTRLHSTI